MSAIITRESRLQKARTKLVLAQDAKFVFLAHLLVIADILDSSVDTACTDGSCIRWNPEFVDSCNDKELLAVLVHELMHVALLHVVVAQNYDDFDDLNIAADLAANSIIAAMELTLPGFALMPGKGDYADMPLNKSLEFYYRELQKQKEQEKKEQQKNGQNGNDGQDGSQNNQQGQPSQNGQNGNQPGQNGKSGKRAPGEIRPAGSDAANSAQPGTEPVPSAAMAAEMVRAMVRNAKEKAEGIGSITCEALAAAIEEALEAKIDYRHVLRRFRTKLTRGGADWTRPNRRLIASGVYAARNKTRKVGDVVVLWDCSGSMPDTTAAQCIAEIREIFGEVAGNIHVWQHDSVVVDRVTLKPGQAFKGVERKTSGGTSHVPVFADLKESGLKPDVVICLTDCQTRYPDKAPNVPVLWISDRPVAGRYKPPFGTLLRTMI